MDKRMQQWIGSAAVGLIAIVASTRMAVCGKSVGSAPVAAAAKGAPAASPDDLLGTKLAFYIDCVNLIDPIVIDSHELYLRFLTPEQQLDEKHAPNVSAIGNRLDRCYEWLGEAVKVAPKLADVEASGAAYKDALGKLEPLLVEAARYYQQNDYKDDQLAKGKALHPQILGAYTAFFAARSHLHEDIDKYNREMLARSLQRIEKQEGKTLHYYSRRIMNDSSDLLDLATDPATAPAKLNASLDAYKAVYAEMIDRASKNPAEVDLIRSWGSFVSEGDLVLVDLKDIQRGVNAPASPDKDQEAARAKELARLREDLVKRYNDMVEESNELEFER
jgi:hypothetical protein